MGEPFISEIRMFAFNFPPQGWAYCDGQKVSISENPTLYSLIGNTFGGDLETYFNCPDLRGRVPIHPDYSSAIPQGTFGGTETVKVALHQLPRHTHECEGSTEEGNKVSASPAAPRLWGVVPPVGDRSIYAVAANLVQMNTRTCTSAGGGQYHNNIQPYQVVNFCICLDGIYPSRN